MRLDKFLQTCIPRLSRTKAARVVKRCAKWPDGSSRAPSERVKLGEEVLIVRPAMNEPNTPQHFDTLYEDDDIVVVGKPAGLPMHPTASYYRNTLWYLLRTRYHNAEPMFAHRLDKETSGIVACGLHIGAERHLKFQFENRKVTKTYLAMVEGVLDADTGHIDAPLAPATDGPHVAMGVSESGKKSLTDYEVLTRGQQTCLVKLTPHTGRQHQLRVHLSSIGHPIIGDKLYGPTQYEPFLYCCEHGMDADVTHLAGHKRHALHAAELTIAHPKDDQTRTFQAPIPDDMLALWKTREKTELL